MTTIEIPDTYQGAGKRRASGMRSFECLKCRVWQGTEGPLPPGWTKQWIGKYRMPWAYLCTKCSNAGDYKDQP